MRVHKFVLIIFSAFLLSVSQPWWFSFSPVFGKSAVVAQTRDGRKAEADRLFNQAVQQYQAGRTEAALQTWEQALIIYREIEDRWNEGKTLGNLGIVHNSLGNYQKAIVYLQERLSIAREIKDLQGEIAALGNLGLVYLDRGDYLKSIEYQQQSLTLAQQIKDSQGETKALNNIGMAYFSMGNYSKAIDYYQQALSFAQKIKDSRSEGYAFGNLGLVYYSQGEYLKAIDSLSQSFKIAQQVKDSLSQSKTLGNLGVIYNSLGNYQKAIEYQQRSLTTAQEIKDRQGEGESLSNLGNTYLNLNEYSIAIEYYQKALAIARQIKNRTSESNTLGSLGTTYIYLGNQPEAIKNLEQQLSITRDIKYRKGEGSALGNIGLAYSHVDNYPKAINYSLQWLAIARDIKDKEDEGQALNNIGYYFYKSDNLPLAEKYLLEAVEVRESLRNQKLDDENKVSLFDTQRRSYKTLQQVFITQNKIEAALEISERGRGRAFVELFASQLSANPQEQFPTPSNIADIKQIAKLQTATLVEYSIIYDRFNIAGKQQIKESQIYIWIIKPTGEILFRQADLKYLWQKEDKSLEQLIETTRDSIGVNDRNFFTRTNSTNQNTTTKRDQFAIKVFASPEDDPSKDLQKLHSILIEPIADLLPTNPDDRVIFVPQDELFLLPFPALLDQKGKYLIEKHTILTAPSIQVLELTRQQKQKNQLSPASDTLIVGNPTMPSVSPKIGDEPQKLADLPGAKLEADVIAKLLGTKALTGDAANKAAVLSKIPQAKIIHLATHGILNNFQALKSAIALAPIANNNDNALLTAEEILDLKLKADLVVLSACDTGRGRITGDGVIGLSRSLFIAGTPSVIVSLWAVPDAPTAELMTEFYKNLYKNKNRLDKAQALRVAMLKMKDKYSDSPRKWAAFTLIGESE